MSNLPPLTPPDSSPVDPAMTDPTLRDRVTDVTRSNVTVGPVSLSRFNWRVAIGLFVGGALWIGPYIASIAVLMPALVAEVAPDEKIGLVATMGLLGALLSLVSNIVFGALSDLTRSRFGKRVPWMVGGGIATGLALWGFSTSTTLVALVAWWCAFMLLLNAIIAPMVAVISDRVTTKYRGTVSAVYGVALTVGATVASITAAMFISTPRQGLVIFAVAVGLSGLVFAVIAPETSNRDEPRARLSARMLLSNFKFPRRGARDYYLALFGKFFVIAGAYSLSNYQLYILLDYIGLDDQGAGSVIAIAGSIGLLVSLVVGFAAGPLSDKVGRRKPFVIGAAVVLAIGAIFPFFAPFAWAMIVAATISAFGNAIFSSVDQALNVEVLPNKEHAAKDLGILNMANSGGQMLGPVITSVIVTITGGYQGAFITAFVLIIAAAITLTFIRKVR
ncbi:MFS transporter [Brevibacterium casei]